MLDQNDSKEVEYEYERPVRSSARFNSASWTVAGLVAAGALLSGGAYAMANTSGTDSTSSTTQQVLAESNGDAATVEDPVNVEDSTAAIDDTLTADDATANLDSTVSVSDHPADSGLTPTRTARGNSGLGNSGSRDSVSGHKGPSHSSESETELYEDRTLTVPPQITRGEGSRGSHLDQLNSAGSESEDADEAEHESDDDSFGDDDSASATTQVERHHEDHDDQEDSSESTSDELDD